MKSLIEFIKEAEQNKKAIGHFNVSDLAGLKAVVLAILDFVKNSVKGESVPVIIGVSEGEGDFIGVKEIAFLVKFLKEEYQIPLFLNADHIRSLEKAKEAAEAGFDAVMFDASQLSLEKNIKKTKEVVERVKDINPQILIEAELGHIKGSSTILSSFDTLIIKEEDLTKSEEVGQFIRETGIDLLAPAIGNIHGIFLAPVKTQTNLVRNNLPNCEPASVTYISPSPDIQRIRDIKKAVKIPLVLHGGSGINKEDVFSAIDAGISVIHINTELRLAWKKELEKSLREKPEESAPYKLLGPVVEEIQKIVYDKLTIFNRR